MDIKTLKKFLWGGVALLFVGLVILFYRWEVLEEWIYYSPSYFLSVGSIVITAGLSLIASITIVHHYEFYSRLTKLGIMNAEVIKKRRRIEDTGKWIEELKSARKQIQLVGISHGGWFGQSWKFLRDQMPGILANIDGKFQILLLDPLSMQFNQRMEEEKYGSEKTEESLCNRALNAFNCMKELFDDKKIKIFLTAETLQLYTYQGDPIGYTRIDNRIQAVIYLPATPNRACPQLFLELDTEFADRWTKCVDNLFENKRVTKINNVEEIDTLISKMKEKFKIN